MKRFVGQAVRIEPHDDIDPATPIAELFADRPVKLILSHAENGAAELIVYADPRLLVLKDEMAAREDDSQPTCDMCDRV